MATRFSPATSTRLVFGVALNVVTRKKVLGGNYGFLVVLPVGQQPRAGRRRLRQQSRRGVDGHVRPADQPGLDDSRAPTSSPPTVCSLPTGRYEDGASNNTGLGMVGQEILFGTTVYLNKQRSLHVATAATFDFFSEKKDSETKVGNILNLEGGVGADFLKGGLVAGLRLLRHLQADR